LLLEQQADNVVRPCPTAGTDIIQDGKITLELRKVDIAEVMEMLSREARVNILLSEDVKGEVSVNLYDVAVDEAGKSAAGGPTEVRTFMVQYSDPMLSPAY
jgi:hypothetical protein